MSGEAWVPQAQGGLVIRIGSKKEKVRFRPNKKAKKQKFVANDVSEIIFHTEEAGDVKFVPVTLRDKQKNAVFMQELTKNGNVKLYARTVYYQSSMPMYGASGGGAPMITHYHYTYGNLNEFWVDKAGDDQMHNIVNGTIRFKSYKNRLLEVFGDCPDLVSSLEEKEYEREDLPALVDAYNACK